MNLFNQEINQKKRHNFTKNFAIIIGINEYQSKANHLNGAVNDAKRLATFLASEERKNHCDGDEWYQVLLLQDSEATFEKLTNLLTESKNGKIHLKGQEIKYKDQVIQTSEEKVLLTKDSRLLFYFAGHGQLKTNDQTENNGHSSLRSLKLLSQDEKDFPVDDLVKTLEKLPCIHTLLILDCCFSAGVRETFTNEKAASRTPQIDNGKKVYSQDYECLQRPTFTVISSGGYRPVPDLTNSTSHHSPFAEVLFEALEDGFYDRKVDSNNDNILTVQEVYNYIVGDNRIKKNQHPEIFFPTEQITILGQYFFLLPKFNPNLLEKIEGLEKPYKGLFAYEEKDHPIFCGRDELVTELFNRVHKQKFTILTGASGSGKSSIVKAGLIPLLRDNSSQKATSEKSDKTASGAGYERYAQYPEKCYGRPEVLQALKYICVEWEKRYPQGPRVSIGNISLANGGPMPPHSSHQHGLDVDIAPVANTNEEIGLTWQDSKYSRQRTQELVDLFYSNPILGIRRILFNDPDITRVERYVGHDNHLHVSFLSPGIDSAPYSSDQDGDLRLVIPPMQGERVRQLQESLANVGITITADGIFGKQTDAAVRKFQAQQSLQVDGIAGFVTQTKLEQLISGQSRGVSDQPSGLTLQDVIDQNQSIPFDNIDSGVLVKDQLFCAEIQTILRANHLLESVDGIYGLKTQEALRNFKTNRQLDGGDVLGPTTAKALLDAKPGAGLLPKWQGGDKQATVKVIIQEANRQGITSQAQIAYILATVEHETGDTFQPVREGYYLGEVEGENHRQTLPYYPYYGRGYVQLTHLDNYREYSNILGLDLVNAPDLVMRPDIAVFVLIHGMKSGVFTGIKLDDCISNNHVDFLKARKIINGNDKAEQIQTYAINWQNQLS
ncbi:Carboxypeptidase (modular protein) [Planktothrix sp. PCC 11201]|uniref:penicillin-insensitive murein endopeptidase n=1 Tax=Planktothrix sp. PCC 11201 TaxID=1729650 RepID=UPI000911D73D|nr:penicillin-insensitive murein endopeptidase [Planktothrix sp. PCC 11201]SKB13672.1 Carboxypeptidase (modular protein) [Planktothrix sp. PCC 11201]